MVLTTVLSTLTSFRSGSTVDASKAHMHSALISPLPAKQCQISKSGFALVHENPLEICMPCLPRSCGQGFASESPISEDCVALLPCVPFAASLYRLREKDCENA